MAPPRCFHLRLLTNLPSVVLVVLSIACAQPVFGQGRGQPGSSAPAFTLANQFGQSTAIRFPQAGPVVLVFTGRSGRSAAHPWLQALASLSDSPRVVSIACTGWVPALFQSAVRRGFAKSEPILIDWNDDVAEQYGYSSGFRLIVVSATGRILATEDQAFSTSRFTAIRSLLY